MSESEYHGLPNYPSGWSSYDWAAVFDGTDNESRPEWSTTTFPPQPVEPISPDHVAEIENVWTQCNEDYADSEIVALIRLTDGRYAAVTAWSDSTGWGCRDATYWKIAPDGTARSGTAWTTKAERDWAWRCLTRPRSASDGADVRG